MSDMNFTPITNTDPSFSTPRNTSNNLGKDDFLKLLVTQLQYQDPMQPSDNQQFMAQMAQFSALEQMQNIAQESTMTQAINLVGKNVDAAYKDSKTGDMLPISGVVTKMVVSNGVPKLIVGDQEVDLKDISAVKQQ